MAQKVKMSNEHETDRAVAFRKLIGSTKLKDQSALQICRSTSSSLFPMTILGCGSIIGSYPCACCLHNASFGTQRGKLAQCSTVGL
jgi:hypothetical protein